MTSLAIHPMQWAGIPDLHETPPLNDADLECMREIRSVLIRHNKLNRFALHLIHKHFDVSDDEVLMEYSEASTREQFFRVEKRTESLVETSTPTTWTLEQMTPMARCVCANRGNGHLGRHETG
jgi:hypothetical protein